MKEGIKKIIKDNLSFITDQNYTILNFMVEYFSVSITVIDYVYYCNIKYEMSDEI